MNQPERFVIDGLPPCTNHSYSPKRRGGMYKVHSADDWQCAAIAQCIEQQVKPRQDWNRRNAEIEVWCYMRRPLGSDWDGRIKLCQDAVATALGFDDRYIWDGHGHKRRHKRGPEHTIVVVTELDGEPAG